MWIAVLNVPAKKEKWFVVKSLVLQWHVPIHPSSMANAVQFAFQWTVKMAGLHGQNGLSAQSHVEVALNRGGALVMTQAIHVLDPRFRHASAVWENVTAESVRTVDGAYGLHGHPAQ